MQAPNWALVAYNWSHRHFPVPSSSSGSLMTSVLAKMRDQQCEVLRKDASVPHAAYLVSFLIFFLRSANCASSSLQRVCCLSTSLWSSMALMAFFFNYTCKFDNSDDTPANSLRTSASLARSFLARQSASAFIHPPNYSFLPPLALISDMLFSNQAVKASSERMVKSSSNLVVKERIWERSCPHAVFGVEEGVCCVESWVRWRVNLLLGLALSSEFSLSWLSGTALMGVCAGESRRVTLSLSVLRVRYISSAFLMRGLLRQYAGREADFLKRSQWAVAQSMVCCSFLEAYWREVMDCTFVLRILFLYSLNSTDNITHRDNIPYTHHFPAFSHCLSSLLSQSQPLDSGLSLLNWLEGCLEGLPVLLVTYLEYLALMLSQSPLFLLLPSSGGIVVPSEGYSICPKVYFLSECREGVLATNLPVTIDYSFCSSSGRLKQTFFQKSCLSRDEVWWWRDLMEGYYLKYSLYLLRMYCYRSYQLMQSVIGLLLVGMCS